MAAIPCKQGNLQGLLYFRSIRLSLKPSFYGQIWTIYDENHRKITGKIYEPNRDLNGLNTVIEVPELLFMFRGTAEQGKVITLSLELL